MTTAVMMLTIFTACESEDLRTTFGGGKARSIKLLLNAQGDEITRAVSRSDGNDAYGENTIATADVFFYTETGTLLYDVAKENVTLSEPVNGVVTATVPMPSDNTDLTQAATVYVMGNRQATNYQVANAKASEAALRALTFTTDLATVPTAKTTFAMDGTGDITVTDNEISGTVELVRNAAKITLTVNLPSTLTADGKTYAPQTNGITITFNEGVKTFGDEDDVFDVEQRAGIAGTADDNDNTPVTFAPFYSYPTTWETGDDNEPYFTLHVPWGETIEGGSVISYKTYHYRVPINKTHFEDDGKTLALNRNHWYQVSVNVGVLGTPEASDEVELTANYEVKPWGNLPIGADLLDFKYLVVDQREISIYNVADAQITFASSNDVTVTIDSIAYYNYAQATTRRINIDNQGRKRVRTGNSYSTFTNTNNKDQNLYTHYQLADDNTTAKAQTVELAKDAGVVNFSHTILADTYVPHDIYITIKHTDDTTGEYVEKVKIIQYPPIYIVGARSNGYVFVNEQTSTDRTYRSSVTNDNGNNIGSVRGYEALSDAGDDNNNKNQYNIHITVAPSDYYLIGDPRVSEPEKISNIFELNETGSMYRPTRTDAVNIIAPVFKIASSYGKTTSVSYNEAKERCASYQENGYPAGRWRIPTQAEFEFIIQRSYNSDIPSLFDEGYYVADGKVYDGDSFENPTSEQFVRCVYDVWYWGNENTGQVAGQNANYQLTHAVWGDTGSVIVK